MPSGVAAAVAVPVAVADELSARAALGPAVAGIAACGPAIQSSKRFLMGVLVTETRTNNSISRIYALTRRLHSKWEILL